MTSQKIPAGAEIPPPSIEEVSPGVFAYIQLDGSWCLNNIAFITEGRGVTVFDATSTERRTRDLTAAIARTSDKPVSTLVNTHSHLDHTFGNYVFGPEVTIVGHELCREEIVEAGEGMIAGAQALFPSVAFGEIEIVPPMLTFDDEITLYAGDLAVHLEHVGPAHTTNDVIAWIPERRLLISGDIIFNQGTPFAAGGSIIGWLQTLEEIRDLGAETLIPDTARSAVPRSSTTSRPTALRTGSGARRLRSGRDTAGAGARHRLGPVQRLAGQRAAGGEPAPRLFGIARRGAGHTDRLRPDGGRDGGVQRRPGALSGLIAGAAVDRSGRFFDQGGHGARAALHAGVRAVALDPLLVAAHAVVRGRLDDGGAPLCRPWRRWPRPSLCRSRRGGPAFRSRRRSCGRRRPRGPGGSASRDPSLAA